MLSKEVKELVISNFNNGIWSECLEFVGERLERLEKLEEFITWLCGTTFRKTDEVDKIFNKLKEILENEKV